jgi:hypothetical protein
VQLGEADAPPLLPQWVPEHQRSQRAKGLAASFCAGSGLQRVFHTWHSNAALKRRVTANWQRLALVKGWNSWRAFVQVRAHACLRQPATGPSRWLGHARPALAWRRACLPCAAWR